MTAQQFLKKWMPRQEPLARRTELADDLMTRLLKPPDNNIWVESVVSHRDFRPVVNVKIGTYNFQVSPAGARKLGKDFLDVAHGAEIDSFLYQFFSGKDIPMEQVGMLVAEFRAWREKNERINEAAPTGPKQ